MRIKIPFILVSHSSHKNCQFLSLLSLKFCTGLRTLGQVYALRPNNNKHVSLEPHDFDKICLSCSYLLSLSSKSKSPMAGAHGHAQIIKYGFIKNTFLLNNLLVMYSKCHCLGEARKVFDQIPDRNLVSWTSMITGTVQNGELVDGLFLFLEMKRGGFMANEFALGSVLMACSGLEALNFGFSLHGYALKIGIELNLFVGCALLDFYGKLRLISMAEHIFESITDPDVACWNALVACYVNNRVAEKAFMAVSFMHKQNLQLDQFTFLVMLKACSISRNFDSGRQVHALIIQSRVRKGLSVLNSLIDMYFKTGSSLWGMALFEKMEERDIISWNTVIAGLAQIGNKKEAVSAFKKMLLERIRPNHVTLSLLIRLCSSNGDLDLGFQIHGHAYHHTLADDSHIAVSLIHMYATFGIIEYAECVFKCMNFRSTNTWNEMISGYLMNQRGIQALRIFSKMYNSGMKPNEFTYSSVLGACSSHEYSKMGTQLQATIIKSGFDSYCFVGSSLIYSYSRFGSIDDALRVFYDMETLDLVCWGAMVSGLSRHGFFHEVLELLNQLREEGEKPDGSILSSALNASTNLASLDQSKGIHALVLKIGLERDVFVASATIDMYAKCGDISSSRLAFYSAEKTIVDNERDPVLYNAMIMACAHHGLAEEALQLFEKMEKVSLEPNNATFMAVISACAHLGLVREGCQYFDSIKSKYGSQPSAKNYGCLVDLLGRFGFLKEAKSVIESMPFEPWPEVWRCLLSGCRIHGNKELGEIAAEKILKIIPDDRATFLLLLNIYNREGNWEDAERLRTLMEERGLKKKPGHSRVETKGVV
ncbi:pentatricopeptide repeat-containing protein At3g02330 [Amborella trichopoda]|uniref:pentatricopeptide repeat-containing protein At3g02330 n=1 Tax=Amborella trichopoda TaxID=13333 RepID=UPI0009BFC87D|nr:pentatricopeptide repeat-containing protein At3g02330 [Amborella trichopoda]|eukprot:XP_011624780.2 pentatricopeptide repeat-containing protein At3g02330 [Amborella trichopoda]